MLETFKYDKSPFLIFRINDVLKFTFDTIAKGNIDKYYLILKKFIINMLFSN